MRYKIIIEYDGTDFLGWQKQNNGNSIQSVIEDAIFVAFKKKVELFSAGRTDAGVHASGQVAHFDIDIVIDCERFLDKINAIIRPKTIALIGIELVQDDFHARFSAKMRHYQYTIVNRRAPVVFNSRYTWQVYKKLDINLMNKAIKCFVGRYNFNAFRSKECQSQNPIRTIHSAEIVCDNEKIICCFSSKSFLQKQVRIMVGTIYMVGIGEINCNDISKIIESEERKNAGVTAPAKGLCFVKVDY